MCSGARDFLDRFRNVLDMLAPKSTCATPRPENLELVTKVKACAKFDTLRKEVESQVEEMVKRNSVEKYS